MTQATMRPERLGEAELSAVAGGSVTLDGLPGSDVLASPVGNAGGPGNDVITGSGGDDRLSGQDGSDLIQGGAGDDQLYGEAGNDSLAGGIGDDRVDGGAGNDVILWSAETGSDTITGGEGQDTLRLFGTGLTLDELQQALMLWGRGGEPMEASLSPDGTKLVVDGLSGVLTIGGHTIDFSGIEYIELAEPLQAILGSAEAV